MEFHDDSELYEIDIELIKVLLRCLSFQWCKIGEWTAIIRMTFAYKYTSATCIECDFASIDVATCSQFKTKMNMQITAKLFETFVIIQLQLHENSRSTNIPKLFCAYNFNQSSLLVSSKHHWWKNEPEKSWHRLLSNANFFTPHSELFFKKFEKNMHTIQNFK